MKKIGTCLATAAGLVALALGAAPEAWAQGFRMVSDGPESVWVLDAETGAVTWCRLERPAGPKVIDVIGSSTETRARREGVASPECSTALGPQRVPERRLAGFEADGLDAYEAVYGYAPRTRRWKLMQLFGDY
jgi:hypothetical protein